MIQGSIALIIRSDDTIYAVEWSCLQPKQSTFFCIWMPIIYSVTAPSLVIELGEFKGNLQQF